MTKVDRITILCRKAKKLKELVVFEGESEVENGEGIVTRKSYFTFKDLNDPPSVTITCNGKITYFEVCTCQHCSIFHGLYPNVLCAYKCSIIKYLGNNEKNR